LYNNAKLEDGTTNKISLYSTNQEKAESIAGSAERLD
jgi:hypothetical protein